MHLPRLKRLTMTSCATALAVALVGCGGSSGTGGSSGSATVPSGLSTKSFDASFSVMSQFKGLTSAGKGLVGVIMPDTSSSTRWVDFDAPLLTKAFQMAGYSSSQFKIDNAQGSDATQLAIAQADITQGATVLVVAPLDTPTGTQIQALAQSHGVKMISYDRATFTGTNTYYISFDNVQVGKLIGQGFESCVSSWNVSNPQVFTLSGGQDTDPNAVSFAQGYNSVIWGNDTTPAKAGTTNGKGYTLVGEQIAPGWVNAAGGTIFQQQFTAHPNINATVEANDGLADAVINVLKSNNVPAKKIPTTGQDATAKGLIHMLEGYQCGTVYKPIYLEAQAATALATIIRAGQTPPSSLVNSTTSPPKNATGNTQPAVLLTPQWVDTTNVASTVIKDKFVLPSAVCPQVGASVCQQYNIPPNG